MKTHPFIALSLCLALTGAFAVSSGCSTRTPPPQAAATVVLYRLVSVNGSPIPATINHGGAKIEVHSGTFTLRSDGTCGTTTVFAPPSGKALTREVSATYQKDGTQLTMQWKGAGRTRGVLDGDTFTMNNEGILLVYSK